MRPRAHEILLAAIVTLLLGLAVTTGPRASRAAHDAGNAGAPPRVAEAPSVAR